MVENGEVYYILNQEGLDEVIRDMLRIMKLELQLDEKNIQLARTEDAYRIALVTIEDLENLIRNLEAERENLKRLYNISDEEVDRLIKEAKKIKRKAWRRGFITGTVVGFVGALVLVLLA